MFHTFKPVLRAAAVFVAIGTLSGCVAYPTGYYGDQTYYAPGYVYAPGPAAVVVAPGVTYGGYRGGGGYYGGYRGGYGYSNRR